MIALAYLQLRYGTAGTSGPALGDKVDRLLLVLQQLDIRLLRFWEVIDTKMTRKLAPFFVAAQYT